MRTLKTSLALVTALFPTAALAQEAVVLEESAAPAANAPVLAQDAPGEASTDAAPAAEAAPPAAPAPKEDNRPSAPRTRGGPESGGDSWTFGYHGYFRAPMRMGIGTDSTNGSTSIGTPVIPDDQYLSWQFSPHNKKDWAEMFFSVGNGVVSGNLAIQGFQFTDSAWAYQMSQYGIGMGWVEINSDLGFENLKFNAKVGSHWDRYGMAGKYDAGQYDTYLFGRTHVMGGTARLDVDTGGMNMGFEAGFGTHQPNPEMYNRARFTPLAHAHAFFNFGDIEVTAHVMHAFSNQSVVTSNYPKVQPGSGCPATGTNFYQCGSSTADAADGTPNVFGDNYPAGSQTVVGLDGRFDLGVGGYLYAGYSHQFLKNALVVSNAIEAIHSQGAGEYKQGVVDNYLESPFCNRTYNQSQYNPIAFNESCSQGNGNIGTALLQYELGLSNFNVFDGDMDLQFRLYSMLNFVHVGNDEVKYLQTLATNSGADINKLRQNGTVKAKFGLDSEFYATSWLSAGLRFDHLRPSSKVSEQTFSILSPRVTFRSKMVTHEEISIQYSRYFYQNRSCLDATGALASAAADGYNGGNFDGVNAAGLPARAFCAQPAASNSLPSGFGATSSNQLPGTRGASTLLPDENVIKIEASMWW